MNTEALESITVGSTVNIKYARFRGETRTFTVIRVTPKQIHVQITEQCIQKFRKSDGGEIGSTPNGFPCIVSIAS